MEHKYLLLLSTFLIKIASGQKPELVFVHVLYRHGDRTPIEGYPSDPYGDPSYWPNGFGQLTNKGKLQQFELGQWLRNRYRGFLPEKYNLNDIYVQSSDYDRTLMSAESNLAGLYRPNDTDIWKADIKWQPIPIHTIPAELDPILACKKSCPRYDTEFNEVHQTSEVIEMMQEMEPLLKYLSNHTDSSVDNIDKFVRIYDNLYIQSINNFKLPEWTKDVYPSQMKQWFDLSFRLSAYNLILQRLHVGLLMNEIIKRFDNKTKNVLEPNRKMWIYSAHDANIANFLMTLHAFDDISPPYSSTILMELYKMNGSYFVSAFYKNDTDAHPISMLGCELECPFEKLKTLLHPVLLDEFEWKEECESVSVPVVLTVVAIIGICCGALLIIIVLVLCCCRKYMPERLKMK